MMTAEEEAIGRLEKAGDNLDNLANAIRQAMFLMETPGENRQKLRAARAKFRKMVYALENTQNISTGKKDEVISPHIKESYEISEFENLSKKYESLNWRLISKPGGATIKPAPFYKLYGYCMQANKGDNAVERPMWAETGGLDFEGRERWDAWEALKGKISDEAKLEFVKLYYEFSPNSLYKDNR